MSDALARLAAALADRYRIGRELGAGGMATVYLARDLKHERDVAIKVLKPELAAVLGAERFVQEIKTTAALQHPHILPLFDSGTADGFLYYVMPFIDGETLRAKLDRETQLSIDEAVKITTSVADALDYAHRQGVIHRDIKPENILLHDGRPMVADFGIALAVSAAAGGRMTETGMSLGTPHYMSPEQATAEKEITGRSDIYSLGSVLYEMLTGNPPHTGSSAQQIIMKIIAEPVESVTKYRKSVPPNVAAAVAKSLEKVPADRFESAKAFAAALSNQAFSTVAGNARVVSRPENSTRALLASPIALGALVIATGGAFVVGRTTMRARNGPGEPIMATLAPAAGENWQMGGGVGFSISPNGRRVAIVSGDSLVVRSLDSLGSQPVRSTTGATRPFWSPDGRSIGFFADLRLKVVDVETGAVRGLCPAPRNSGGTWGEDGTILYMADPASGLHRTRVSGASCEKLNIALPADALDGQPYFLPDARHFVYTTDQAAYLGDVDSDSLTLLAMLPRVQAVFAAPDYLLFTPIGSPQQTVFAQRIDVRSRKLVGDQVKILDRVSIGGGYTSVAASASGTLIAGIQRRGSSGGSFLNRIRSGGPITDSVRVGRPSFGSYRLSHDGRRIVFGGFRISIFDIDRAVSTTLIGDSPSGTLFQGAQWSPKDTAIAYRQRESVGGQLAVINVATGAIRKLPGAFPQTRFPRLDDWSADGRYLACLLPPGDGAPNEEAWIYDLESGQARKLFEVIGPSSLRIAPNGRSIAYVSDGVVYIRPFPDGGAQIRISPRSGRNPRWRADARELFYIDGTGAIVGVPIGDEGALAGAVRTVLAASAIDAVTTDVGTTDFEPSPDGKLFHVTYSFRDAQPLTVLTNWWKHAGVDRR